MSESESKYKLTQFEPFGFSPKEREILILKANGLSMKEIAHQLNKSFHTVKNQIYGTGKNKERGSILEKVRNYTGIRHSMSSLIVLLTEQEIILESHPYNSTKVLLPETSAEILGQLRAEVGIKR